MKLKPLIFLFLLTVLTIHISPRDAALIPKTDKIADKVINIELKTSAYHIKALKTNLFLGIFPITSKIGARISVETGQILEVKKPWYLKIFGEFLFREIKN